MRPRGLPAIAAGALLMAALAAGCRVNRPPHNHARAQILYDSTISDPRTFNPILVTDAASGDVVDHLFEGLVRINPVTTLPEPGLAQSWEISDGGKTITFHLRHDVKWSDGVPFTAHDVVFTTHVIYDPHVPNIEEPGLTVDGQPMRIAAPDDYTVVMKLPRPFAPLLYAIGFPIIPAHILEPALKAGNFNRMWGINTAPAKLVEMGPFLMTHYVASQQVAFKRNPDYWMRDEQGGQLPRLHGWTTLIVQDQNAAYLRFLAGQLDIYQPRPDEVATLKEKAASLKITLAKVGIDTGSLFFAFNRNPHHYVHNGAADPRLTWFTDINFMRALAHLVDKRAMINLCYFGLAEPAASNISPADKIFHNPYLKGYDYDPALAQRLLDEAGYRMIRPGVRGDPEGHPLIFNLTTNTGESVRDEMCAIFKQDLTNVGIQVNYRPLEFTTLVEKLDTTFDWDCVLIGFTGTIEPNNGADFLRSSGTLHLWNPSEKTPATPWEAEIDKLLEQGTMVMDPKQRAPYYWKIQRILHDELPIIETVRGIRYVAYKNRLENFKPTVWGRYRPEYIEFSATD
ncbi:MAG: ABC transporter substrate-binding protein [Candidatus Binataceae bacterium]